MLRHQGPIDSNLNIYLGTNLYFYDLYNDLGRQQIQKHIRLFHLEFLQYKMSSDLSTDHQTLLRNIVDYLVLPVRNRIH